MGLFSDIPQEKKSVLLLLAVLSFGTNLAFQGWSVLYNNFAVNEAGFTASQSGLLQGLREIPGFLGVTLIFFLLFFKEHRFASICCIAAGAGTMLMGFFPSFGAVVFTTCLMSLGFHYFESINNSLTIQHFNLVETPVVMGRMRALTACACLLASFFVFAVSGLLSFKWMFFIPGSIAVILGISALFLNPLKGANPPKQSKRIVFRHRYWLFYVLTFLMGGRRVVFTIFSVFLLVEQFNFSVRSVSFLFMFNYAVNWFFNPLVGKIINRWGERRLLTVEYVSALVIFLSYAFFRCEWLIMLFFVLDSLTYNFAIAVRTFFQKIAFKEDVAPNMALAQTINHIPAVLIPALGGWMWVEWGYSSVFVLGASMAFFSLCFAQCIDREISEKGKRTN